MPRLAPDHGVPSCQNFGIYTIKQLGHRINVLIFAGSPSLIRHQPGAGEVVKPQVSMFHCASMHM